ncbi:anthrone oxygenase family protein [Robiginitalea sp. IMCC44478]|uniref:anthrone oxygenase family protein n=1 Tax=Robiginitalea sp. IMCC44478 TaxID=3459122 RepID=UPI004041AEFE
MDFSLKTIILFAAVVLTGLSAGLFYAWSVSVIPGTKKLADLTYLETMQSINKAILNPGFFLIFFGSIIFLIVASIYEFHTDKLVFGLLLGSAITYLIGTIVITGLGNVPLNDQLDLLRLGEMSADRLAAFREYYESNWNRWHLYRTIFAVLSFLTTVCAILVQIKKIKL